MIFLSFFVQSKLKIRKKTAAQTRQSDFNAGRKGLFTLCRAQAAVIGFWTLTKRLDAQAESAHCAVLCCAVLCCAVLCCINYTLAFAHAQALPHCGFLQNPSSISSLIFDVIRSRIKSSVVIIARRFLQVNRHIL
jgi:hypothetical protein